MRPRTLLLSHGVIFLLAAIIFSISTAAFQRDSFNNRIKRLTEEKLKSLLTTEEWNALLATANDKDPNFAIVYPRISRPAREKRGAGESERTLDVEAGGSIRRRFRVHLARAEGLVDPSFVALSRWQNRTSLLAPDLIETDCYYTGVAPHRAAVAVCGGMRGIITMENYDYFVINPLPNRLHKRSTDIPHIIVQKTLLPQHKCSHDLMSSATNQYSSNTQQFTETAQKLQSNSDLGWKRFRHFFNQPSLLPNNIDSVSKFRNENSINNSSDNSFSTNREQLSSRCGNVRTGSEFSSEQPVDPRRSQSKHCEDSLSLGDSKFSEINYSEYRKLDRRRRMVSTLSPVYVETAVFVDRDLFRHMTINFPSDTEKELVRFVLAMVNAVQLLYHDPSLGRVVNFVMKRLEILHADPTGLTRSHDIDRFLNNFCAWQRLENPPADSDPLHWDHALILTGLDLYVLSKNGKLSSQVVGLAPVAGMCTPTSSCTVNEGRHFESVYVVAHEIGHNLGMRHDGPLAENNCDPASYLMSPTLGSGKITWSACSKRYLEQFLRTTQSRCLMDHSTSSDQLDHGGKGTLPGERFGADQQCALKYGEGSLHASTQPLQDICRDLHCSRDHYTWTSHPALEGTTCGKNKWCRSGRCITHGLSALQALEQPVAGGWSEWGPFSECASGCLHGEAGTLTAGSTGVMFASRQCNNPRPENGGDPCVGHDKKYKTCNAMQCANVPRTTIRDFADEICIRTKEVDKDLIGTGLQRISSDAKEACTVWCYKRRGGSKSRGWSFPDGTTCRTHRAHKPMFCISGVCQEFTCQYDGRKWEEDVFSLSRESCPIAPLFSRDKRREVSVSAWMPTSDCFHSCISPGSGIRVVERRPCRKCNTTISVQLCQPKQKSCGRSQTPVEYASTVCTKYSQRVRRLSGLGMQLSATADDSDRPCRLACQDDSVLHRFYLVNGEEGHFPFGTDCSRGDLSRRAFCVSGKCLDFGSDDAPLKEYLYSAGLNQMQKSIGEFRKSRVERNAPLLSIAQFAPQLTTMSKSKEIEYHQSVDLQNPIDLTSELRMTD
ncbi:A disintegrin and metalloproteinase with thrombospondin motifs adt-1 [Nilaparvata lugens]|uniref:A disintegrin and metalloproteinase with thrombospondin motifs adt-1 n=1 Tax=Nilaparvata lugens TaxID=108931 RepID=UPI00193DD42B|nr:A disintegrin and metalloproteinase with thrombospondin motifs adt-1 [Nilaparvata lugens]